MPPSTMRKRNQSRKAMQHPTKTCIVRVTPFWPQYMDLREINSDGNVTGMFRLACPRRAMPSSARERCPAKRVSLGSPVLAIMIVGMNGEEVTREVEEAFTDVPYP